MPHAPKLTHAARGRDNSALGPHPSALGMRKILHIDMDAFYASVEQRDDPSIRGKPVIVGWPGERSVVCAASYEARKFGVHSAMPALRAKRFCPEAVFIYPNFDKYRAVSKEIRAIFERHTPLVEPLSLDEAYLDVTRELTGIPTATETAETIRREIREETHLTASAGVAPNKFLAKIASDWRKPDGCFVIPPHQVERFFVTPPVRQNPRVRKAPQRLLTEKGLPPPDPPASAAARARLGEELLTKFAFGDGAKYRLAGIGLSNFLDEEDEEEREPSLFEEAKHREEG